MNRRTLRQITLNMLLTLSDDATKMHFETEFNQNPEQTILYFASLVKEERDEVAMETGGATIIQNHEAYSVANEVAPDNVGFVRSLLFGIYDKKAELDEMLQSFIENYTLDRVDPTDHAILQMATYELKYSKVPLSAVCSEAVHLSQWYGGKLSRRFVNGVIGSVGFFLRTDELAKQWQKVKFVKGKLAIEVVDDEEPAVKEIVEEDVLQTANE